MKPSMLAVQMGTQQFRWSFQKKGSQVFNVCRQFLILSGLALGLMSGTALANPMDGVVVGGSATISSSGSETNINQSSQRAIIDWKSFDIAKGETTRFIQPGSSAVALNRVVNSSQISAINGNLLANGRVIIINPNGVVIGSGAHVDTAGFIATAANIGNNDFMNATGALNFNIAGNAHAVVENQGHITVQDAGLVALVAPTVRNSGVIEGNLAKIQMGAADTFGVDLYGDGLIHLAVTPSQEARTLMAENSGSIVADGGKVLMTAAAASDVVNSVINHSGVIEAVSLVSKGGQVILTGAGADVKVSGKIDVSGETGGGSVKIGGDAKGEGALAKAKTAEIASPASIKADATENGDGGSIVVWSEDKTTSSGSYYARGGALGGNGGLVETSSKGILEAAGTAVDTTAALGSIGEWLLDPITLTVDAALAATISASLSDVNLVTSDGMNFTANINVAKAGGINISATAGASGISMGNNSINTNGGNLSFSTTGSISFNNSSLLTRGGNLTMSAYDDITLNGNASNPLIINTSGGDIDITVVDNTGADSSDSFSMTTGRIATAGGDFNLTVNSGDITFQSTTINTTGGSLSGSILVEDDALSPIPAGGVGGLGSGNTYASGSGGGDINIDARAFNGETGNVKNSNNNCFKAGGSSSSCTSVVPDPIAIAVTAAAKTKVYGSVDPALTYTYTGTLFSGDSFTGALARALGENVGSYFINQGTLAIASSGVANYTLSYTGANLTITKAPLTITPNSIIKTYGDTYTFAGTEFTAAGLKFSDAVTGVTLSSLGAPATAPVPATPYGITASNAVGTGLSNYNISYVGNTFTVNPALLTITASNRTKTYGDALALGTTAFTTSGLKNSDSVTSVTLTSSGAVATANVGGYSIVPSAQSGSGLSNYIITLVNGTLTVNPAALTITASNRSKTYGDTLVLGTSAFTTSGLKNSDSVTSATLSSLGDVATANVGGYNITPSAAVGTGLSNYNITYANGTLTVNPAALTVQAGNATKVYGDGFVIPSSPVLTGLKNGQTLSSYSMNSTTSPELYSTTAGVGTYNNININSIGLSGGAPLSNYTITYLPGVLSITPKTLTVTANSFGKTYGDAYTFLGTEFSTAGLINGDMVNTVDLASLGAPAAAGVGSYAITGTNAVGTGLGNYAITYVDGTLTIDQKALTITANSFDKTYGDDYIFTGTEFTVSGLLAGDSVLTVDLASAGALATANVGGYAITGMNASGTGINNYAITYVDGTLTVNKAALTVTADNLSKIYGEVDPALSYQITSGSLKNADAFSGDITRVSGENVGDYAITQGTLALNSNYALTFVDGNLEITPYALTVTADDKSKVYGAADPALTYQITSGELQFSDAFSGDITRDSGENVGDYAITQGTLALSNNYVLTFVNGNLEITARDLIISALSDSKTYDGTTTSILAPTVSGLQFSDGVSDLGQAFDSKNAGSRILSVLDGYTVNDGNNGQNYNVILNTAEGEIYKASLYVNVDANDKVYDGTTAATLTTASLDGTIYGTDDVSFGDTPTTGTFWDKNAGYGKLVFINGTFTLSGDDAGNYNLYQPKALYANITPAQLIITANDDHRPYSGTPYSGGNGVTYQGFVNGEDESVLFGTLTYGGSSQGATDPGNYSITPGGLYAGGGYEGEGEYYLVQDCFECQEYIGNYDITYVDGTLTIDPKPVPFIAPFLEVDPLGRPVISYANQVIVLDAPFEQIETVTQNTNVSVRGETASLAGIEPAAGDEETDPTKIEPAAGGTEGGAAQDDIACANSFLDNKACEQQQAQ